MNNTSVKTVAASVLFLFLLPALSAAQERFEDKYNIYVFNMENGLPGNFVDDLFVDKAGFLWISTGGGGLCRYDGSELLTFSYTTDPPVKSNFVRNVVEDDFSRLWVASEGGLDILDLKNLSTASLELPIPEMEQNVCCSYLTLDATGSVWAKFGRTLYRISFAPDGTPDKVLPFSHEGLSPVNYVFKDVDADGSVWAPLGGRLYKVSAKDGSLVARLLDTTLDFGPETYVSDFLAEGAQVWISTENGLYRLHRLSGAWKRYVSDPSDPHSLTQNFVTGLAMLPDGQLLASTLHGLNVYDSLADNFTHSGEDVINGLQARRDGLLVATETDGWRAIVPKQLSTTNLSRESGLPPGAVNAIWQEASGRLWVGLVEGGLNVREPGQERFVTLTRERNGLAHNSVSALRPGPDQTLYVGTWGGGIDLVQGSRPYKVLSHLPAPGNLIDFVGLLEYDSRNKLLWIGSNQGIFLFDPASRTYEPATREVATGCIGSCMDRKGNLWVGSQQGLFVFNLNERKADGTFPYRHYPYKLDAPQLRVYDKICCISEAPDGTVWLGSNGGGVYRALETEDGWRFEGYSSASGLSSDLVRGVAADARGQVWISTVHGLNRLSPESGAVVSFLREDGLPGDVFHWNNTFQGSDGLLYFGHVGGVLVLDPKRFQEPVTDDPLRLTLVSVGEKEYRDPFLKKLRLKEGDRSVRLCFSLLGLNASRVHYLYQLDGFDRDWISLPPGGGDVKYSALPGGRYTFRVRAMDAYGNVVGSILLPIEVKPYFYRTWWFFVLVVAAALIAGWLVILIRTRSYRRRQQELERTVELRTQEISAQKRLVEQKAEELNRQNQVLLHQNEALAQQKLLFAPERRSESERKEDQFREKALDTLRRLYKNPDLDVNLFCRSIGISKTLLNTRLQESFGQSIGQLIRTYRLAVARELLESGTGLTVSEIAYEVGFNDPKYFTRCFTKEFGTTPSSLGK